jgi:IclR family KDG regulon transcriptional repressor
MKQHRSAYNSIEKAIKILLTFQEGQPLWGVRELSAKLGFSPATVQRILKTLKAYSFLDQDEKTRQYRLGNIYYKFLHTLQSTYPFTVAASPFMNRLLSSIQETVHLNVIEGMDRLCIDNIESHRNLKASMPIGSRSPLYAGASSKCLLAFSSDDFVHNYLENVEIRRLTNNTITNVNRLRSELEKIKRQGYAASLGEHIPGLGSISAPVFDHKGLVLASISLAIPEIRYIDENHRKICIKELLDTTRDFSKVMGYKT